MTIKIGDVNGRLTVLKLGVGNVKVRCECGTKKRIVASNWYKTKSCGCLRDEVRGKASVTHGMSGTPTYQSWRDMLNRCNRPKDNRWKDYGGRGIRVCKRWRKFENFLADVGVRPENHTLGRIDNDGNYEPGNVAWQTLTEQGRNKQTTHWLTFRGQVKCAKEWSVDLGIDYQLLMTRLKRGWSADRALTEPIRTYAYEKPLREQIMEAVPTLGDTFTSSIVAHHLGYSDCVPIQDALKKLAAKGRLERVARGIYMHRKVNDGD
jgi:hypothetical protein